MTSHIREQAKLITAQLLSGAGIASGYAVGGLLAEEITGQTSMAGFAQMSVILGAGLLPDGGIRDILDQRLRTGLRLANGYPTTRIIVTGGVPQNGRTEAQAMSQWLIGAGVDPRRITEENDSNSTVQNAQFTDRIFRDRGTTGAVVVTNDFHLKRALLNFRQSVGGRIPITGVVAN